ncbi:MAG: hypothetical protein QOD41_3330 [Cryptosporangiaceae bacterium]|nr:hypothetical protein [Cryptosporangiaceae bacterium]
MRTSAAVRLLGAALAVTATVAVALPEAHAAPPGVWRYLPGTLPGTPFLTVGHNADGRLDVFAENGSDLYHQWQLPAGGWSGWEPLGSSHTWGFAVASEADGRLRLFQTTATELRTIAQDAPNGSWGSWTTLHTANGGGAVVAGRDPAGRLHVFSASDDAHQLLQTDELAPNGAWGASAVTLAYPVNSVLQLKMAANADGRPEVFSTDIFSGTAQHRWQWPDGTWSGWASLGHPRGKPGSTEITSRADGTLELYQLNEAGQLWSTAQVAPNGGWDLAWHLHTVGAPPPGCIWYSIDAARDANGQTEFYAAAASSEKGGWLKASVSRLREAPGAPGSWAVATTFDPNIADVDFFTSALDGTGRLWFFTVARRTSPIMVGFQRQSSPGVW